MTNVLIGNGWADTMAVRAPLSAHELLPLLRMLPVEGETAHAAVACLVQLLRRQVATPSEMLIALELHDAQGLNDLIRLLSGPDDPIEDGEQAHEQEPAAQLIQAAMGLVASLTTLVSSLLADSVRSNEVLPAEHVERLFIFSLIWSLGGILETDDRLKVDLHLRELTKNLPAVATAGGASDTVYEYRVHDGNGEWEHWGVRVPEWVPPPDAQVVAILG